MENYAKNRDKRIASMAERAKKAAAALIALKELGVVPGARQISMAPDNVRQRRSYAKRLSEDGDAVRKRNAANAMRSYWKDPSRCRERHRAWSKMTTVSLRVIEDIGINFETEN